MKYNILDFLVHGGHQYEFFKNNAIFYCSSPDGKAPNYKNLGRPEQSNVVFIDGATENLLKPDIVMVRHSIKEDRILQHVKNGAKAIAVIQTIKPYKIPDWCDTVIWNSKVAMENNYKLYSGKKHIHIVHGFDPSEFLFMNLKRNGRILTSYSMFKQRGGQLGFNEWSAASKKLGICDLLGHGNEGLQNVVAPVPMPELARLYNEYTAYLNTATESAMPRSRGEAMMCGTPIITTSGFDTDIYFKNGYNCLIANNTSEIIMSVKNLLRNKTLQNDITDAGIETAVKYFNINNYIKNWSEVFDAIR